MNWDQIEGKWTEIKGSAREKWGDISDDELDQVKGNREKLAGKVQQQYGKTKEEAEKEVDEWLASL